MRFRGFTAALTGMVMIVGPLATAAGATGRTGASSVAPAPAPAASVDLRSGWGTNKACLQRPDHGVECFATADAMKVRSDQLSGGLKTNTSTNSATSESSTASAQSGSSWCPVFLYSGFNYSGQVLEITSQGWWINLSDYGFDKRTVSFIGYGCGFHLAEGYWGGGWWYPGYTGAWAYTPNMGSWNWRTTSVYIY